MSNEELLHEDNQISYYRNEVLSWMGIFNIEEESFFPLWLNKFEYIANMIEVPQNKMAELFVAMLDVFVDQPVKKKYKFDVTIDSYDQIFHHYSYLYLDIEEFQFHRSRFTCREQYVEEPIGKFAINLKKISNKCNYESDEENKLCHQFLNGIRDDDIKTYLKTNPGLSFNNYVEKAIEFAKVNNITHYLNQAFPKINIYKLESEGKFYEWLNKFEYVANMIEVPDDRIVEFFKNMVDNDVHTSVQKTCPSVNFSELSYEELVNHYLLYFAPSFDDDLHIRRFICRNQYENETIYNYADNLRKMYNKCNSTDRSEKILCEQFFSGIRDYDIKTHLSETLSLSFDEIVEKAIAFLKDNQTKQYLNQTLYMMHVYKPNERSSFLAWLTKFEAVANLIEVPYERMGELFITMLDDDVHKFINNNSETDNCFELSYDQILDKYQYLFFGTESLKVYRTRFSKRKQFAEEPIKKYAENLQKVYSKCDYTRYFDKKLCKKFINGLRSEKERNLLRKLPCLSFVETVAKAIIFINANDVSSYLSSSLTMINVFNPDKEDRFYEWFNKFEYVADIVGVPDDNMIEFFNAMLNIDAHNSVKKRFSSVNFLELTYNQLTNQYLRYYAHSNESDIHEKRFMCRNQYEKETIRKYANNLQKIYNNCSLTDRLEEKLSERFINGIRDDDLRSYLKKFPGLSFVEIVEKAIAIENDNNIIHYLNSALSMINIYNPEKEGKFYEWLNKFEYVADTFGVPDFLMVKFFNKLVDNDVHESVMRAYQSINFSELSYDEIIKYFFCYFPSSSETDLHRKRFLCRNQYEEETIENYADSLRKIYNKCNDTSRLEEELCEQFLNGINDDKVKAYFKEVPHLSFDETVVVAADLAKCNEISTYVNKAVSMIHTFSFKEEETFDEWLNKFEYVADIVEVPDNKMIKFFNEMVDNDIHTVVKKYFLSVNFSELPYEKIINHYLRYFSNSSKSDLHRKRFQCRNQYEKETIENYANQLRKIYNKCYYKYRREERLCEYFIKGIRNDDLKNNLSKIPCTSLDATLARAIGFKNVIQINDFLTPALSMIQSYNTEKDGLFYEWLNKFEYVADTLGVPDFLMVKFFNKLVDNDVYESVMRAYESINFSELSYDEIIKYFFCYFPSSSETDLHRKRFLCRNQYEEETIENYADSLRKIYNKCNDTSRLEEELCEQFLNGINDDKVKAYFKELPRISFDETVVMTIAFKKEITLSQSY